MSRKRIWHSRRDVMRDFVGEDSTTLERDNERFSHRVYKDTECGAWCKFVEPTGDKPQRGAYCQNWRATLQQGIDGVHVKAIRPVGGRKISPVPKHVRDFLLLPERGSKMQGFTDDELRNLKPDGDIKKVSGRGLTRTVTFKACPPKKPARRSGVICGSIVEGSDAEVGPYFEPFPLTPERLDQALTNICDEVTPLWEEANRPLSEFRRRLYRRRCRRGF